MDFELLTIELIREYISCAKYMCKLLKEAYPAEETFLTGYRQKSIPKTGELDHKVKYNFHGGGCHFELEEGAIDIDFGPADRCDGFDPFRLLNFLRDMRLKKYSQLDNEEVLQNSLLALLSKNKITQPKWYPNPDLFYLTENLS